MAASDAPNAFRAEVLSQMDAVILSSIQETNLPGGVLWLEHHSASYHRAYGNRSVWPKRETMTEDTVFDAASLTKVIATTPAVMLLIESGAIDLDDPVSKYFPEFAAAKTHGLTVRHLMTHTSGLPPGIEVASHWSGYSEGIRKACSVSCVTPPGSKFTYSDINFILLGDLVGRVSGRPLNEFVRERIYQPLGMRDTGFLPSTNLAARIAPTERLGDVVWRGVVHDPTSRAMGGVAGHAGLFTTTADLARFARMMLGRGSLDGCRVFRQSTVELMTRVQTPPAVTARRGLGWDIDSPYAGLRGTHFPIGSYGHTGWTGTSIWIDPFSNSFVIFLSNRNHPTEEGTVGALRAKLGTLSAEALSDFDFSRVTNDLPPLDVPTATKSRSDRK